MPKKNGLQVVQEIKFFYKHLSEEFKEIEIVEPAFICLTAFKTPQFSKHLISQGFDECYEKPLEIETLIQILESHSSE